MAISRRIILISIVVISIAASFWTGSRYPGLQDKADVTGTINLEDTLTHEPIIKISKKEPFHEQVLVTTVNWAWTNRQGMTFAVFLAAGFLTLFGYLPQFRSRNRFLNSVYGMATGTPLGVCVNCVAPIAKAMYEGGRGAHMALATLFSSPSLNIIVLTMLFTFFPLYMVVLKLGATFFLILAIVPFLAPKEAEEGVCGIPDPMPSFSGESWFKALIGVTKDYSKSFVYIVIRTVPLMFVAGFLGALVSHVWDPNQLIGESPSLLAMIGIALFGTFLPLPIAFDVMLAQSLFMAHVPVAIVGSLLFTTGIFSIYSFFIIWRTFTLRLATVIFLIVSGMGVAVGYMAQFYSDYKRDIREQRYEELVLQHPGNDPLPTKLTQSNLPLTFSDLHKNTSRGEIKTILAQGDFIVEAVSHAERKQAPISDLPFTKEKGAVYGIDSANRVDARNFIEPFFLGRGLASGDFNKDGWVDLIVASTDGFELYQNINGEGFKQIDISIPELQAKEGIVVAMVDLNNDSWLDFYVTTYAKGNYIILNPLGNTSNNNVFHIHNEKSLLTNSVAFGDINNDSWLDIFHGNWNGGELITTPGKYAENQLFVNKNMDFSPITLPMQPDEIPGNTMATLFSDINNDGHLDLFVGNDYEVPDAFYLGRQGTEFYQIKKNDKFIPLSPVLNMSIDTADFNNDNTLDLYMTGGTWIETEKKDRAGFFTESEYCNSLANAEDKRQCMLVWLLSKVTLVKDFKECDSMKIRGFNEDTIRDCMVAEKIHSVKWDKEICDKIPAAYNIYQDTCYAIISSPGQRPANIDDFITQVSGANILLGHTGEKGYKDLSLDMNVNNGAWSWAAKFADVDNDTWQDLYVVNGSVYSAFVGPTSHSSNVFFHNQQGKIFHIKQEQFGLDDWEHSSSFTYIDFDNDGDLDIITNTSLGPIMVYRNNDRNSNSITFELKDSVGNTQCIGCKLFIFYGDGAKPKQIREVKASGGYMSFDAPVVHFGLGDVSEIKKIGVVWSTGEKMAINQPFAANHHYVVTRKKPPTEAAQK